MSFYVFDCSLEGSLQDRIVGIDWCVEFTDVAMVGVYVLNMLLGKPYKGKVRSPDSERGSVITGLPT